MAVNSKRGIWGIGDEYETDPARIADVSTLSGGLRGIAGGLAGKVANTNIRTARALRRGIGDFLSMGAPPAGANPIEYRTMSGKKKAEITTDVAKLRGAPAPVPASKPSGVMSQAQAAEIPKNLTNAGAGAALAAMGGAIDESALPTPRQDAATPPPTEAGTGVTPSDTGAGFAIVDGKRINYSDIGTSLDPLKKNGGFAMAGSVPGIGEIPADPAIGAMDREVKRIQGVQDEANLAGIGYMRPKAARRAIAFRQRQQDLDQQGRELDIKDRRVAAEEDFRNRELAAKTPLMDAQAANTLAEARAREFAISPEGVKQAQSKGEAADYKENVNRYFNMVKERNLPQSWAGKHMEIARKYAMADDPANDYGIFFNPATPDSMGIGTSKKLFLPILQEYMKKGYSQGDAMARAFQYLQGLEKTKGKLYEDVPNIDRLPYETKPQY